MAAVAPISLLISSPNFTPSHKALSISSKAFLQRSDLISSSHSFFSLHPSSVFRSCLLFRIARRRHASCLNCSAANKPSPSSEISSTARIRSEVLSPFRSVRMFFYLAFIASGALGGLIATSQLISALTNPSKTLLLPEILKGLGIDLGAILLFYFLYARENKAKDVQLAKLFREESLSKLKLCIDQNKMVAVNDLRGVARLVILAGPAAYINESFKLSEAYTEGLLERGVLVVPFATDKSKLEFESVDGEEELPVDEKRKKLWQLRPVNVAEWSNWIDEQKKLATVSPDSPVYLSLRMDGRVRGSGVGYPPWNALVAQLPPVKGLWSGILDGMDGRVLIRIHNESRSKERHLQLRRGVNGADNWEKTSRGRVRRRSGHSWLGHGQTKDRPAAGRRGYRPEHRRPMQARSRRDASAPANRPSLHSPVAQRPAVDERRSDNAR